MSKDIKSVFDEVCDRFEANRSTIKTIRDIRLEFMNRNEDHLEFFTGNLIGVNPIRYKSSDRDRWFEEVLEVDEEDIREKIKRLDTIDDGWVRANDSVNLSCVWITHKIMNSTKLSAREKEQGMTETILMFQYKLLSSVVVRHFPYLADRAVAIATYEALSRKFEIKQYGSWQGLLDHRTKMILSSSGIHYESFLHMRDDKDVINVISDVQKRLREIVKKIHTVFARVKEENLRVTSKTTVVEIDGEKELLEKMRDHTAYTRYLKNIISDKPTFIRSELVDVVSDIMSSMNPDHLRQALDYCSDNFGSGGDKKIEKLLDETLLHAYQYLSEKVGIMANPSDIGGLVVKLKNIYSASRMSDSQLIEMRDLAEAIVKRSVRTRNRVLQASVRTGLQIYIVLRAFAKKHYQG
ncbi:MAG: hypothetical protein IBX57_00045 [Gammaproteobacteria bacterium]|nr:hypothetical protein [Gammaproteobacteria bacterium]